MHNTFPMNKPFVCDSLMRSKHSIIAHSVTVFSNFKRWLSQGCILHKELSFSLRPFVAPLLEVLIPAAVLPTLSMNE